jgi:primary-amine oxidase
MARHPLDPLDADEIRHTAAILRRDEQLGGSWRFAAIELREPAKADVGAWRPGDAVARTSYAVLWNRADNQTWEGVVDLTGDRVVSWTHVPDVTPNFTVDEYHEVDEAIRAHPDVIAALADRGITDLSLVLIEVWTYGKALMPEKYRDRRLGWCDIWYRETPDGNPYAHPVSGLKVVVDMNTLELLELENDHDHGQPDVNGEYAPGPWTGEQRADLAELDPAARLQPPRGPGHLPGQVRRPRHGPRHRLPDVVHGDGGAVSRRVVRPLPADGVRHR